MSQEVAIALFAVVLIAAAVGIYRKFSQPSKPRKKLPFPGTPRNDEKDR